jgi:ElaB/YqjD/DUF883 family membrane-anchored ribosome-binding protein
MTDRRTLYQAGILGAGGFLIEDVQLEISVVKEDTMAAEKQESGNRSLSSEARGSEGFGQAGEALEGLRSVIDQASRAVRDLTQASQQWTKIAQERGRDMGEELRNQGQRALSSVSQQAQGLREQGEWALGGVTEQVERNPLTSLTIAFALGYLAATLMRR